jgi:phospholipid/cholesterol/gamma-HCH transport system substrate-binding protein
VRGSQNAPFNGVPKEPTQAEIAANSNRPAEQLATLRQGSVPGTLSQPGVGGLSSLAGLLGLPG